MEWTRDRGSLQWAVLQNNLGGALQMLGERENGTARLQEAIAAYRDALMERTHARVPLDWAQTHDNLRTALPPLAQPHTRPPPLHPPPPPPPPALTQPTPPPPPLPS